MVPLTKRDVNRSMGRTRGGLTLKIHALVDADGQPVDRGLSKRQHAGFRYTRDQFTCHLAGKTLLAECDYGAEVTGGTAPQAQGSAGSAAKQS